MPKTGMYVLQGVDPAAVAVAPFDIKVIEVYNDNGQLFTTPQVQQMGGGAGNGLLLGYFSIGEAENYRDYFKTLPSSVIGPVDPSWPGDYQVAYWSNEWKAVATNYLNTMIKLGYDGMYLDVVDEYQMAWATKMPRAAMPRAQWSTSSSPSELRPCTKSQLQDLGEPCRGTSEQCNLSSDRQRAVPREELFYTDSGALQSQADVNWTLDLLHKATALGKDVVDVGPYRVRARSPTFMPRPPQPASAATSRISTSMASTWMAYCRGRPSRVTAPRQPSSPAADPTRWSSAFRRMPTG